MELFGFLAVISIAAVLQGVTGFGFALLAAPLALLFTDKITSVLALTFVSITLNAFLLWSVKSPINKRLFRLLFGASLVGLPVGLFILNIADIHLLRIAVGVLSILFAVLLYFKAFKAVRSRFAIVLSGALSGMLHTSMAMSGPPIVLLLTGQRTEKDEARRTFAAFFLAMSLVSVGLFVATRTLTDSGITFGLWGVPAALIGGYIGTLMARVVPQKQFTILTFGLVCVTGVVAIYSGLTG